MNSNLCFSKLQSMLLLFLLALVASCAEKQKNEGDRTKASAKIYITALDKSQLLQENEVATNSTTTPAVTIQVDPSTTYQEIDGFGFTLTGGSALHMSNMSAPARAALLQELFGTGTNSIGVSYLRLSVGGSDLDEYP